MAKVGHASTRMADLRSGVRATRGRQGLGSLSSGRLALEYRPNPYNVKVDTVK